MRFGASLAGAYVRLGGVVVDDGCDARSLLEMPLPLVAMLSVMLMRHTPPEYRNRG